MTVVSISSPKLSSNPRKPTPPTLYRRPLIRIFTSHAPPLNSASLFPRRKTNASAFPQLFRTSNLRITSYRSEDAGSYQDADGNLDGRSEAAKEVFWNKKDNSTDEGNSFLTILAIAVGVAAVFTISSIYLNRNSLGSSFGVQFQAENSVMTSSPVGFHFKVFGYKIILPEYAPGWIYFWLLMAAGCGLFISEEALNVWVGITLSRLLTLDGTWQSFVASFSKNAPYIISTILWVYWGVCISDMIPFYLGKLFRESGATDDICSKLGIGEEKVLSITQVVQNYGNRAGFVERLSVGVRNTTAFVAGSLGISAEYFFAGVCCGGLITLPLQLGIGFLLRERPMVALATVATIVGIWTVFPYAVAACTALFLYVRRRYST